MTDQPTENRPGITAPRMLILGVGSSGARAVAAMCQLNPDLNAAVIDTDTKVLEALPPVQIIPVGTLVTQGQSAGGDVELGRQSVEKESPNIRQQFRQVDLLVVVAGLGGGTGSGAVPVITRIAQEAGALVLSFVGMPFKLEGKKAARIAEEALKRIRTHSDAVIRIHNERLVDRTEKDISAEEAFGRSHETLTEGVFALGRMLSENGVCGLDFACIHTMLRNCDGFCHFANAAHSGADRAQVVADEILNHRLLNKGKTLEGAVGIIIGLTGGSDLTLSEIETFMEKIQEKLPEEVWLNFGLSIDSSFEGRLSAMVLVAEQWKEPLVNSANRQMGFFSGRSPSAQGELPLETAGKGSFTYVDPTIHNNQDLDVPTYIRRDIKLPK